MVDTIDALAQHLQRRTGASKIVIWAHNSHLGDARATEMGRRGELNVGQLVRERHGDAARLIGFSTFTGTVTAADDWDGLAEKKRVREALPGSYERLFHEVGIANFYLPLRGNSAAMPLERERLERAIGVIYRPDTERMSHYFFASLPRQFDAIIHYDVTEAVVPVERWSLVETHEAPETYPSAL